MGAGVVEGEGEGETEEDAEKEEDEGDEGDKEEGSKPEFAGRLTVDDAFVAAEELTGIGGAAGDRDVDTLRKSYACFEACQTGSEPFTQV